MFVCTYTSHKKLRPKILDAPRATQLCRSSALPVAQKHSLRCQMTVAHPGPSRDFMSENLFSVPEPTCDPVHPVCVLERACLLKPCLPPPVEYPLVPNHASVMLTSVSACLCILQSSCQNITASGKDGHTEVNLSWIWHISEMFVSTVTELQWLCNRFRHVGQCLRW